MMSSIARAVCLTIVLAPGIAPAQTLPAPATTSRDLYPAHVNAAREIREAVAAASRQHKRVLLVFGGNWCYDCHVLDAAFQSADIKPLVTANYVVVHVDIGHGDKNLDIARKYKTNIEGVPAIAVLDSDGSLVYSDPHHRFSAARLLQKQDLIAFLEKWKPLKKS